MDDCETKVADPDELVRFNEAIDQAVAQSATSFNSQIEQNRNLLLGMLGHDMRSPLQAIQVTASYLAVLNAGEQVSMAADRLIRSGARIQGLLDDLTAFNRTRLGLGINVKPTAMNLMDVLSEEMEEIRVAQPDRQIELGRLVMCMASGTVHVCGNCWAILCSTPSNMARATHRCG